MLNYYNIINFIKAKIRVGKLDILRCFVGEKLSEQKAQKIKANYNQKTRHIL